MLWGIAFATPFFILWGWLSDKIGRKWIMMVGMALAVFTYRPIFNTFLEDSKIDKAMIDQVGILKQAPAAISKKEVLKNNDAVIARRNDAISSNVFRSVTLSGLEALQKPGAQIPPEFSQVHMYFEEKNSTKLEAEKFFNHYESNGWLVGGKSKMKNWQAAARNWMLNSKKFTPVIASVAKQNHLNATTNKSYQDKL